MKRRLAWAAGTLVVAVAALVALFFALIDTPAVQAELQQRLSRALQGQVTWEALDLALLPAPHGELRRVRFEIPGKISAAAEDVNVYLRLWPLLRGSPEISSVTVRRPQVRITPSKDSGSSDAPPDAVALYRSAIEPVARALQDFAPDMAFKLEQASVELGADFALRDLRASARTGAKGVDLELAAASNLWKRLSVDGRIEYADLSARADVELDLLVLDKNIPAANLRAKLRTDAKTALECDFDATVGSLAAANGKLVLPAGKPLQLAAQLNSVDVAQAIAIAKQKLGGLEVVESAEGRLSAKVDFTLESQWQLHLDVLKSDAAVKFAPLPWKLSPQTGRVTVTPAHVRVTDLKGSLGESGFEHVTARIDLGKTPRVSAASGNAILRLEQWFPWLQAKAPLEDIASLSGSVEVALSRLALRFDRPAEIDFDAVATPRKVSAALKMLPAAVTADGGAVRAGPKEITLKNVAVAMLDAHALLSGTVRLQKSAIELAVTDGSMGEKLVRWAMQRAEVPARLEPKTPLRFAAQRIAWTPKGALEADARIEFDGGPAIALALAWRPELLELRRVAIKDARSDAVLGATVAGDLVQASFSGTLHGQTIPAMLRQPLPADSGTAQGELRVTIDRKRPERTFAEGKLRIEALDLSWLAGKKAVIERAEIVSERTGVRIPGARFGVEDQFFELRGEGKRTDQGPVIDARIESAGVMLDRLLPPADPNAPKKKASPIWPLPVSGRVEVSTGFVQYKEHRIEPFAGVLSLERERARLDVKEARMCGVSFPMEVEAQPENTVAAAHIRVQNEPLERTVRCLTGGGVELTGDADLTAELRVEGRRPHLVRGLTGTAHAELRQGRVKKFALLGNILSFRGLASINEMKEDGFAYRRMTAKGRFERGEFLVDEAFFDSEAVRLAAHGRVDLLGANSQLTVLVGLLTRVDRIAGAVPILGDVFGGSMTALPMQVNGDIRNPTIVPLGPRAVSDRLLGIFERTLKLPGKLLPGEVKPPP
jgi:AsmA-like protein